MGLDLVSLAKVGLKLLVAVGGGYIVYKCLKTDSKKKDSVAGSSVNTSTEDNVVQTSDEVMVLSKKETIEEKGKKIVDGLMLTSAICNSAMGVLKSFAGISGGIDSLFNGNLNYFDTYSKASQYGEPGYPPGDFPWNRPDDNNIYNTPIYRGKDFRGNDMYWIKRPNGVIEVW